MAAAVVVFYLVPWAFGAFPTIAMILIAVTLVTCILPCALLMFILDWRDDRSSQREHAAKLARRRAARDADGRDAA
jgi:hypothetical protein